MKKCYRVYLVVCLTLLSLVKTINGAVLSSWDDVRVYHPDPMIFVHGMNSSPEAWGFQIDPITENVIGYNRTSMELRKYFDEYLKQNPDTKAPLTYIEPFNYGYNTFDAVEWNSCEGYNNTDLQYPDNRIAETRFKRPTLRRYIHKSPEPLIDPTGGILSKYQTSKVNLVAHSLGGVVSRYYINKTQGANVKQLTTLGTPHKGTLSATLADIIVINPITDPHGHRRIWRIRFFSLLIKGIDVNRKPNMIDELKLSSQFISELNSSIPSINRYYCIGGLIRKESRTDGFIELESALASKERLPLTLDNYQPKSILPNYKGKILFPSWWDIIGLETNHLALPEKWEEILKAIDSTKPKIEITSPQEGFVWEPGATITLEGKVYDEYLPADCSIKIELYKAGYNDYPIFSEVREPDSSTGYTPLKPSDLWRANDPNTPVAEFREDIMLPSGANPESTYTIKLTVINPAGISSDIKQVTEKTFYLYGVAKDGSGVSRLWCIDGPTSFADGVGAVVSEFDLVDEEERNISSRPLDIAISGNTIWVSFDDKKIRKYNIYGEAEKVGTNWYWTVSNIPDGLYYGGGGLQYCSSSSNKIYNINTDLGVVSRRLAFDGEGEVPASISNHYTDQEYIGYNPTAISASYLCSASLNKISKRSGNNYIPTLPTSTPIWTNEQDTPAPVAGIVEVGNTVSGSEGIYLSCTDGDIYKVRFVDKSGVDAGSWEKGVTTSIQYDINAGTSYLRYGESPSHTPAGKRQEIWANVGDARYKSDYIYTTIVRKYGKVYDYANRVLNPIKAYAVHKGYLMTVVDVIHYDFAYGGYGYSRVIAYPGLSLPADSTYRISYSFDDNWTLEQKFNSITEGKTLWVQHNDALSDTNTQYDPAQASIWGGWGPWYATLSPIWSITNVSENISTVPFFYTVQYNEEVEDFTGLFGVLYPGYVPVVDMWNPYDGFMVAADIHNGTGGEPLGPYWQPVIYWSFLLDEGSLEVLDQFTTPTGIWEGIGTGNRINMRIKTGYPSSINIGGTIQLEAHGKEPLIWKSSDEAVGKVDSNGLFTAVGKGTCTVTVQDALGNTATSDIISVQ